MSLPDYGSDGCVSDLLLFLKMPSGDDVEWGIASILQHQPTDFATGIVLYMMECV